jgi:hypothetical protein
VSTTITGLGVRSPIADNVLDHHRAHYRPRVVPVTPPPLPVAVPPVAAVVTARAALTQVLVIRVVACMVLWAAAGIVYGCWQLGGALMPSPGQHGVVICGTPRNVGSIPGC